MITAALRYFATILALSFLLGTVRTLWLTPWIGATPAVLLELPVMLLASWLLAARIVRRARLGQSAALAMGLLAFLLLMTAEAVLAIIVANQSLGDWIADLARMPGGIGLAGQIAFGLFPWLAAIRLRPSGD